MKTALEELIEYVAKYEEVIGVTAVMIKNKATNLLEKEKRDIVEAYNTGLIDIGDELSGDIYFYETFKNE